jgi:hypothetical protein
MHGKNVDVRPEKGLGSPLKGLNSLIDLSGTLSKAIRKLTTLAQDLKLVVSAVSTTVITEEACLCNASGLTFSGTTDNHGLPGGNCHDQLLLGFINNQ